MAKSQTTYRIRLVNYVFRLLVIERIESIAFTDYRNQKYRGRYKRRTSNHQRQNREHRPSKYRIINLLMLYHGYIIYV